jgi:uncharacterized FlaG/YvyC family protein
MAKMAGKKISEKKPETESLKFIQNVLSSVDLKIGEIAAQVANLYGEFKEFKAVQENEIKYLKEKNEMQIESIQKDIAEMNKKCSHLPCRDHTMLIKSLNDQLKDYIVKIKEVENANKKQDERFHKTVKDLGEKFNSILMRTVGAGIFLVTATILTGIGAYIFK